jgi:phospholipid/cholesterol/gamma-HCH transport system ATP-binding protein
MIEYQGIHKSFGDNQVLEAVDLKIQAGETFFVLGKTGAGKTVLIRLLVGLLKPDAGRIFIDGEDITDLTEDEFFRIRKKCGMVFQFPTLFDSINVFENVAFGLRRHSELTDEDLYEGVKENLGLVHLSEDVMMRMPEELSFGMQKRVGLARTIALRPSYLLYDEPTTGLDPFTAGQINKLMNEMAEKLRVTSIVVSHDLESMKEVADRVALLEGGNFAEISRPEEFLASPNPVVQRFISGRAD